MEKPLPAEGRQRSSGVLLMSARERERSYQMRRLANKALSLGEAATLLTISVRQCRLYQRWRQFGDNGLISGHRGRASNNRQDEMRVTFISWYSGLHPHGRTHPKHASGCFHEATGIRVSKESTRRWLSTAGYWQS